VPCPWFLTVTAYRGALAVPTHAVDARHRHAGFGILHAMSRRRDCCAETAGFGATLDAASGVMIFHQIILCVNRFRHGARTPYRWI